MNNYELRVDLIEPATLNLIRNALFFMTIDPAGWISKSVWETVRKCNNALDQTELFVTFWEGRDPF